MTPSRMELERLYDLLADRAGGEPVSSAEQAELEQLLARHGEVDEGSFERAAAALHLGLIGGGLEPMPAGLRRRLLQQAPALLAPGSASETGARCASEAARVAADEGRRAARAESRKSRLAWFAAAAAWLLYIAHFVTRVPSSPGYEELRSSADSLCAQWAVVGAGAAPAAELGGEVVWSPALQAGFLRLHGLPPNDPLESQYQLWIFDAKRPAEYPVDGGVFDAQAGEFTVPIDAKLPVEAASLFAITLERPGGVVVSTRERLLLTAAP